MRLWVGSSAQGSFTSPKPLLQPRHQSPCKLFLSLWLCPISLDRRSHRCAARSSQEELLANAKGRLAGGWGGGCLTSAPAGSKAQLRHPQAFASPSQSPYAKTSKLLIQQQCRQTRPPLAARLGGVLECLDPAGTGAHVR